MQITCNKYMGRGYNYKIFAMPKPPMISTEDAAAQQGRRTFAAQDLACHRPSGRHRGPFQGSKVFLGLGTLLTKAQYPLVN